MPIGSCSSIRYSPPFAPKASSPWAGSSPARMTPCRGAQLSSCSSAMPGRTCSPASPAKSGRRRRTRRLVPGGSRSAGRKPGRAGALSLRRAVPALPHLGAPLGRGAPLAARAEHPSRLRPLARLSRRLRISGGVRPSRPADHQPVPDVRRQTVSRGLPGRSLRRQELRGRCMHRSPGPAGGDRLHGRRLPGAPGLSGRPPVHLRSAAGAIPHARLSCRSPRSSGANRRSPWVA